MKSRKPKVSPRSLLGPAGKTRPPNVEKLRGDELPPPEEAKKARERTAAKKAVR